MEVFDYLLVLQKSWCVHDEARSRRQILRLMLCMKMVCLNCTPLILGSLDQLLDDFHIKE